MQTFPDFVNKHKRELLVGKKTNRNWLVRRAQINEVGRGAEEAASLKRYITAWGDFTWDYDEAFGAKAQWLPKKLEVYLVVARASSLARGTIKCTQFSSESINAG